MNIQLNVRAVGYDGRCGQLGGLVVNSQTDEVTHLILKTHSVERLAPVSWLEAAQPHEIKLKCRNASIETLPTLFDTEVVRSPITHYTATPDAPDLVPFRVLDTYMIRHEHLAPHESELVPSMSIFAKDGFIGHVRAWVMDEETHQLEQVVVHTGSWWKHYDVPVSMGYLKSIEDEGVYLKCTRGQIQQWAQQPDDATAEF